MGAKNVNENTISLKFYHEKLVSEFERMCSTAKKNDFADVADLFAGGGYRKLTKDMLDRILNSGGGFDRMLCLLREAEIKKKNEEIHFDFLFVSLSRIVPIIDRFVCQLCDLNIGRSIVGGAENVKPMRRALAWLYVYSTKETDLEYQDIQRTQRLVRNIVSAECELGNYELNTLMKDVGRLFDEASVEDKARWVKRYKDMTEVLLNEMFDSYGTLHAYYDIMRRADREMFEAELIKDSKKNQAKKKSKIRRDYHSILLLAKTVLTIILRNFVSFSKISDINFPHGEFANSDLISIDLSGSNFISSDFSQSDLTDAILRNSDVSVCNLTYCNAQNADFSGCKLNSSDLLGSDFTNSILSDAQMSAVRFRNIKLDFDPEFYDNCKNIAKIRKHIKMRADYHNSGYGYQGKLREFFDGFSIEQQDFENGNFTKLWQLTVCAVGDTEIAFKTSMDGACEQMENDLKEFFDAYRYRSVPFSLISDANVLKKNTVCFKLATMNNALMPDSDLSYVNFESTMVSGADLSGCKFWYTNFINTSLASSNVSGTEFYGVALTGANCSKTNFIDAKMINCDLVSCNLSGALLINTAIINEMYCTSAENGARKPYVNLIYNQNSPISDAIDDMVFDENNSLCDANLDGVLATNSIFSGLNMDRSSWRGASLKKAILFNSVARWTFFNDVDFSYAILLGISFHQASLAHVLMPKSRLYVCDMSGVKLNGANMTGCKLERVIFQNADLSGANFSRAIIVNCHFNDVNFSGTNFSGAKFENVIFENVDFSECIGLANASFHNCAFGNNCSRLEYQLDANHKTNKNFMSIMQRHVRMKFFRESERTAGEVDLDRYSSLSYYLKQK